MNNEVLEYEFVSKLSSISMKLTSIKKQLWKDDRKYYKLLKEEFKEVDSLRESTRYYVMSSNEVRVQKGLDILKEMEQINKKYQSIIQLDSYASKLLEIQDEIDTLFVTIKLSPHEKSFFAQ